MLTAGPKVPPVRADPLIPSSKLTPQPKFGQPVLPNLNVRHLCPNCRTDPPNIVEEYSKGDLVRFRNVFMAMPPLTNEVCGDCGTILGDRIVDTRSECEFEATQNASLGAVADHTGRVSWLNISVLMHCTDVRPLPVMRTETIHHE